MTCRNLLIYLNREAQQRAFATFHFALRSDGLLFLGTSESVEDGSALFRAVDKKHRLYVRQPAVRAGLPLPSSPATALRALESPDRLAAASAPGRRFLADPDLGLLAEGAQLDRAALTELHVKLIERHAPPSVVINDEHELVHLSQRAGRFLQLAGGEPSTNLLRIVLPALRVELRAALFRTLELGQPSRTAAVPLELDGAAHAVTMMVTPAPDLAPGFLLVIFEAQPRAAGEPVAAAPLHTTDEPVVRQLERELEQVKRYLRDTVEQYEASAEEMKASNEEFHAMNEELRSATEELEASREELQSINEELTTVNQEMKAKVDELAHANSDLQNLMASTSIATVFLDRELRIMRYTPSAATIFHLIPGDLGRPLAHLKHRLEYPALLADAAEVLRTLLPGEREVRGDGRWYLARALPYRTVEDHIAGVVLTFVDVTERNQARAALRDRTDELDRSQARDVGREHELAALRREVAALRAGRDEPGD